MKWRCPYCRQEVEIASLDDLPHMPFCSQRCRMADLHGWVTDRYVISRRADEDDIGETSAADVEAPVAPPPRRPHGAPDDDSPDNR